MKVLVIPFVALSIALSAQTAAPTVAGKWAMALETPHGKMMTSFELKVDGKKVSGAMTFDQSGSVPLTGEFAESKLRFTVTMDIGELVYVATLKDADTLVGVFSGQQGDLKGTATRVKTK